MLVCQKSHVDIHGYCRENLNIFTHHSHHSNKSTVPDHAPNLTDELGLTSGQRVAVQLQNIWPYFKVLKRSSWVAC